MISSSYSSSWKRFLGRTIILLIIVHLVTSCSILFGTSSYICLNQYIDGYWGNWTEETRARASGAYDNLVLYHEWDHPSDYGTKVIVNGFSREALKSLRSLRNLNDDAAILEYSGTIEFYSSEYTVAKASRSYVKYRSYYSRLRDNQRCIRYSVPARILMYKKQGRVYYNVFFEDVGIGFGLPYNRI